MMMLMVKDQTKLLLLELLLVLVTLRSSNGFKREANTSRPRNGTNLTRLTLRSLLMLELFMTNLNM